MSELVAIKGVLLASRIPNLLIIGAGQVLSASMLARHTSTDLFGWPLVGLVVSTMLVAAGGYIINDYYDAKIDLVNRPRKVIIGKILSRRKAMGAHTGLSLLAIAIGFFVSWKLALVHFATITLLWYYSNHLRRYVIGKIVIAGLAALSILLVGSMFGITSYRLMAFAAFGGSIIWIRELIKDLENRQGEQMFGVESIPEVWGLTGTKVLITVIGAVGITLLIYFMVMVDSRVFFLYYICLSPMIALFIFLVIRADRKEHFKKLRLITNFLILAGLMSMLVI